MTNAPFFETPLEHGTTRPQAENRPNRIAGTGTAASLWNLPEGQLTQLGLSGQLNWSDRAAGITRTADVAADAVNHRRSPVEFAGSLRPPV